MGYDVELIPVKTPPGTKFPLPADRSRTLVDGASPLADPAAVRAALLALPGTRPGPAQAVDYLGRGLSYARFEVRSRGVHVENNCGARDLLLVYDALQKLLPDLLILDLQSGELHNRESFSAWWSKPL